MGDTPSRLIFTLTAALALAVTPSVTAPTVTHAAPAVDASSAEAVRASYRDYKKLAATPIGWTGDANACRAGTPTQAYQNSILSRVNIMRGLAGQEPVKFSATYGADAQAAALIMDANSFLHHYPDPSVKCYTAAGDRGAQNSNLYLGWGYEPGFGNPPDPIVAYMDDYGDHNIQVGHRVWILRPETKTMGSGSTNAANALWVVDGTPNSSTPQIVPWPAKGFFPSQLLPTSQRWSVQATGGASLTGASVSVTGPSGTVRASVIVRENDRLVWTVPKLPAVTGQAVAPYKVTVTGITGGGPATFSYTVNLIDGEWVNVYTTPGQHKVNGRDWNTRCERYSSTVERCFTDIIATQVSLVNGRFVQNTGWVFNNLTYKASPRTQWAGNPLGGNGVRGYTGSWTAADGRKWRVECDTTVSGRNGCRAYVEASIIKARPGGGYQVVNEFIFNNIVLFS